jgi:hypothetical protein
MAKTMPIPEVRRSFLSISMHSMLQYFGRYLGKREERGMHH